MQIAPFRLERFFAPHEFSVKHVLCASDCESMSVGGLLAMDPAAQDELLGQRLTYSPMEGLPALRASIAELYRECGADDVIVVTGGGCAIELAYYAALEPGDHVVVMTPAYESSLEFARFLGCHVTSLPVREGDGGWMIDLDELQEILERERPALLVLNMPHNPTGYLADETTLRRIISMADEHGVRVFSDEIFRLLEHEPGMRLPSAADLSEGAVALGAMSKSFGMPGLRIGWLVTRDATLRERIVSFLDYTTKDSSVVSQVLAQVALRNRAEILGRNLALVRSNLARLDGLLGANDHLVRWHRPSAGVIAFPRFADGRDTVPLFERLVERGVLIAPGVVFDAPSSHFRIGFGRLDFPQALEIFREEAGLETSAPVPA